MRIRNTLFIRFVLPLFFLSAFQLFSFSAFGQGSLTPPGAPAPTMKSLDQIEARTPISSAPFAINASGSYYLTKNLTVATGGAIFINVSDVTLDLNGFTISSTQNPASSGNAISGSGALRNVNILNGTISSGVTVSGGTYSGTGFGYGIYIPSAVSAHVSRVSVAGVLNHGIYLGFSSSVVEACTVDTAGGYGIAASVVSHSTALNTGSAGVYGNNVSDCLCTSSLYGIYALTVSNSYGASTGFNTPGIFATTATNCYGVGTSDSGVKATNIDNCFGTTSGGSSSSGIYGETVNNSRGTSSGAGYGLRAGSTASNSSGYNSSSGSGLSAFAANSCYGYANGAGTGLSATTANASYGYSDSGTGLSAENADNCNGATTGSGKGLNAQNAANCNGFSPRGTALYAETALNCKGESNFATGLEAVITATSCYGRTNDASAVALKVGGTANVCGGGNGAGGVAIQAAIGIGCTTFGGSTNIPAANKYLGTP